MYNKPSSEIELLEFEKTSIMNKLNGEKNKLLDIMKNIYSRWKSI
jgi:hypothetical protein